MLTRGVSKWSKPRVIGVWSPILILSLTLLLILTACSRGAKAPAAPGTQAASPTIGLPSPTRPPAPAGLKTVPRERTLVMLISEAGTAGRMNNPDNFNMFLGWPSWHTGAHVVMNDPLIMYNVLTGEYENWLAESWQYNADFTELTMKLRQGIEWGDGKAFTAHDVAFTFNYLRKAAGKVSHLAQIEVLKEGGAQAVDDLTVKFVLKEPSRIWWNTTLTSNHGVVEQMLREDVWGDKDITTFTNYDPAKGWPLGTGPFKLVHTSPERMILDRRDSWWAAKVGFKPMPEIERVIILPGREESQQALMMLRNEIDVTGQISVATIKSLIAQNPKVRTFSDREAPYGYLDWCPRLVGFNNSEPPFNDKEIRKAVNWSIDRAKAIEVAESLSEGESTEAFVLTQPFVPRAWNTNYIQALTPLLAKYGLDSKSHLDKAEQIMKSKGYAKDREGLWAKDGKRIDMNFYVPEFWKQWGPPIIQQLRDAGFNASFDISQGKSALMSTGEVPYIVCWGPTGVKGQDPWALFDAFTSDKVRPTGKPGNYGWADARWSNKEFDRITNQIKLMDPDDPKTVALFVQAMDIWLDELPHIYFSNLIVHTANNTTYWTGWPNNANPYGFDLPVQQEFLKVIVNLKRAK